MNTSQRSYIRDDDLEETTGVRPGLQIACWAILGYSHSEWFVSELSDLPLCIFTARKAVQKCSFPFFSFTTNSKTFIPFSYCRDLCNKFLLRSTLGHHLPKLNLCTRRHCTLDRGGMFGQPQTLQGMDLNHRTRKLVRIHCHRYSWFI